MTRNKDILHCLPLLASVLARRYGVTVLVGGSQASTDGKTIHLPSLPIDCDDEWLALVRGYVDHESAHIRHTDFSAFRNAQLDTVTGNIFNALEDWRVEKCLSAIFPGCRRNLDWLIRRFFTELPTQAGEISPACVVSRHVLLTVRSWDVPEVAAALQVSRMALTALSQESARRIEGILEKVRSHCPDTLATINYARQLAACIPREAAAMPVPASADKETPSPADGKRTPLRSTGHAAAAADNDASTRTSSDTAQDTQKTGQDAADNLPQQLGEWLANRLSTISGRHPSQDTAVSVCSALPVPELPENERKEALRSSQALRIRLNGLLQARAARRCRLGRRGSLHSGSLYRSVTGNPRLFLSETVRPALNTAVHILLDCSGSMSGEAMLLARQACFAVAVALSGIKGVNPAVTAFPAGRGTNNVFSLLRHGERMTGRFAVCAAGGTPLGPALWWVLQTLHAQPEGRKILLILTDGVPDSFRPCEAAINNAVRLGVEVYGIGIRHEAIRRLLPDRHKVIRRLTELAPAMFHLLQTAFLQGDHA